MSGSFKINLKEATRLTRLGKLDAAVEVILGTLQPARKPRPAAEAARAEPPPVSPGLFRAFQPPDALKVDGALEGFAEILKPRPRPAKAPPSDGRFTEHVYANGAGSRHYKLYVPQARGEGHRSLIVMLHGCTQSPDDFAAGTRMNELAEEFGFLVAYPAQPKTANASKCWNWFNRVDQQRNQGEPSLIAGITRQVIREHDVDTGRVFVAGLSAGGAAAAIMAQAYPDLYCAAGIHSGLACGAARDMASAFAAMKQGPVALPTVSSGVPLIIFHGDRDQTVNPANAKSIVASSTLGDGGRVTETLGRSRGGADYSRTVYHDADGRPVMENWSVHGGGHAWFGGSPAGTYTDPAGPDASREMIRFFLEQART